MSIRIFTIPFNSRLVSTGEKAASGIAKAVRTVPAPVQNRFPAFRQQGAFTYFFLKALMGEGDENENGWVDTLEAYQYACDKLEALGLEQNPQMSVRTAIPITRVK